MILADTMRRYPFYEYPNSEVALYGIGPMTYGPIQNGNPPLTKAKKSWGDKLGLSKLVNKDKGKAEEQSTLLVPASPRYGYGSVNPASNLAKSMRYADNWIQGSVAVRPPQVEHHHRPPIPSAYGYVKKPPRLVQNNIYAQIQPGTLLYPWENYAAIPEVLYEEVITGTRQCCCDEYVFGTQKTKRNKSCKKCGGERKQTVKNKGKNRAKLDPSNFSDPYEYVRQTRLSKSAADLNHQYEEFDVRKGAYLNDRSRHNMAAITRLDSAVYSEEPPTNKISIYDTFSGRLKLTNNLNLVSPEGRKWGKQSDTLTSRLSVSDVNLSDSVRLEALDRRRSKHRKSILECNVTAYDLLAKHTHRVDVQVPLREDLSEGPSEESDTENRTVVNTSFEGYNFERTTIRVTGEKIKIFTPGQSDWEVDKASLNGDVSDSTLSLSDQVSLSSNETLKFHNIPPPPQVPPPPPPPVPVRPPRKSRGGHEEAGHGLLPCVTPAQLLHVRSILKKTSSNTDTGSETDSELYSPAFRELRQRKKKVHFRSNHDITLLEVQDGRDASTVSSETSTPVHVNTIRVNADPSEPSCPMSTSGDHCGPGPAHVIVTNSKESQSSKSDNREDPNVPQSPPTEEPTVTQVRSKPAEEICRTGIRRSLSERIPSPKSHLFNDTMRLKQQSRGALFTTFRNSSNMDNRNIPRFLSPPRPKVPPPPPPKRHSICSMPSGNLESFSIKLNEPTEAIPMTAKRGVISPHLDHKGYSIQGSMAKNPITVLSENSNCPGPSLESENLDDSSARQNKKMVTRITVGSSCSDLVTPSVHVTSCDDQKCDTPEKEFPPTTQRTHEPVSSECTTPLSPTPDDSEHNKTPKSEQQIMSDSKNLTRPTGEKKTPPSSSLCGISEDPNSQSDSASEIPSTELNCARSRFCLSMLEARPSSSVGGHPKPELVIKEHDQYEEMDALYEQIREHIYEELDIKSGKSSLRRKGQHHRSRSLPPKAKSMFEGASKYDILSYLEGVRERGLSLEELDLSTTAEGDDVSACTSLDKRNSQNRISNISSMSDSSDETTPTLPKEFLLKERRSAAEVERNDSGVGSETSKPVCLRRCPTDDNLEDPLCEDCDQPYDVLTPESLVVDDSVACRKCSKKRQERKEIITEIIETEIKYGRDLRIIQGEFHRPMLVAGLLTPEQLDAIFLNIDEMIEINSKFTEKLKDALEIALDQGDEDLSTVNIGKLFLDESTPMLRAFEGYCVRQGAASVLLANLEKEKELLRIFLRVSQMENTLLRRMNLSSFLMVPVQRVTKYPLLLGRLYKVTPHHHGNRETIKLAQRKIELHLEHMNAETKDMTTTKLWRRISIINSPSYKKNFCEPCEQDMGNIKLRKMAMDALQWNSEEVRFVLEGRLSFTQSSDNMFTLQRKSKAWKLTVVCAILVTFGKPNSCYRPDLAEASLFFPQKSGIKEATLVLVKEKNGKFSLLKDPLSLDKCIVCSDPEIEDCFEVNDTFSKESFIFKADDPKQTQMWYHQLRYHSQGLGSWRRRRPALANIMINGMSRS